MAVDSIQETRSMGKERGNSGRYAVAAGILGFALITPGSFAQAPAALTPPAGYHPEKDTSVTAVNQPPDANRIMEMRRTRVQMQRFAAANAERMRQLSADSARLAQLVSELNQELEKPGDINLALAAKASLIEKLAHAVQEKMKLTVGTP